MSATLLSFIQVTYSTALPLVLAYIVSKINRINSVKDASKETDMLVLRLILIDLHDRAINKGYITRQMYITFDEVWTLYSEKYKGNHLTEKFKNEIDALPIRVEDWEEQEDE